jgi:CMP-N-acetylneuraminic acid synthetase
MDAAEAWDIDEELDFAIADFFMKQRKKQRHLKGKKVL